MNGIINVLKPCGMSSNTCVNIVKKKLGCKKTGHLGTLDPDACGVLPVCVNKATRLFEYYLKKKKKYRAIFVFGKETDTLDSAGVVIKQQVVPTLTDVQSYMNTFVGKINQLPPNYSAKKINGKKAYELSRDGEQFDLKPKEVEIYNFVLIDILDKDKILVEIECSSGTYVRSLCRDLARIMGTVGYVGAIIRLGSGDFNIYNSVMLDDMSKESVVELSIILKNMPSIILDDNSIKKLYNGIDVVVDNDDCENILLKDKENVFAICTIQNNTIRIKTNLKEEI